MGHNSRPGGAWRCRWNVRGCAVIRVQAVPLSPRLDRITRTADRPARTGSRAGAGARVADWVVTDRPWDEAAREQGGWLARTTPRLPARSRSRTGVAALADDGGCR